MKNRSKCGKKQKKICCLLHLLLFFRYQIYVNIRNALAKAIPKGGSNNAVVWSQPPEAMGLQGVLWRFYSFFSKKKKQTYFWTYLVYLCLKTHFKWLNKVC